MRDLPGHRSASWGQRGQLGRCAGLVIGLIAAVSVASEPVWGHRGALGLTVGGGGEFVTAIVPGGQGDHGLRAPIELGGTLSVTDHTEVMLSGRVAAPGPRPEWAAFAGIRNSRGERLKTFFDLLLGAFIHPIWTLGFRLGLGVQYEVLPVMGVFAVAGVQGGFGAGLRLSFELLLGLQFRTYLFE